MPNRPLPTPLSAGRIGVGPFAVQWKNESEPESLEVTSSPGAEATRSAFPSPSRSPAASAVPSAAVSELPVRVQVGAPESPSGPPLKMNTAPPPGRERLDSPWPTARSSIPSPSKSAATIAATSVSRPWPGVVRVSSSSTRTLTVAFSPVKRSVASSTAVPRSVGATISRAPSTAPGPLSFAQLTAFVPSVVESGTSPPAGTASSAGLPRKRAPARTWNWSTASSPLFASRTWTRSMPSAAPAV